VQFCLHPLPHFHHNIAPVGPQLAACARLPRLVGHGGRGGGSWRRDGGFGTVGTAEASAGWPVLESPGLFSVVRGKGYSSRGTGEGNNRTRDAYGIKTDVLQFTFRSVGL